MKRNRGKNWIGLLMAAALLVTCAVPVTAEEMDVIPETPGVETAEGSAEETPVSVESPAADTIQEEELQVTAEPPVEEAESEIPAEPVILVPQETDAAVSEESGAAGDAAAEDPAAEDAAAEDAAEEDAAVEEEVFDPDEADEADEEETLLKAGTPTIEYKTHVQDIGWQDYVKNGALGGTSGRSKRLEAIQIKVSGVEGLGVEYCTHVQNIGWQSYVANDALAGTTGQSLRLEAFRIRLTGEAAKDYDVYYCVHVQDYGWLNWAKNDEIAGTAGYSKRAEGICIKILPKGSAAPANLGSRSVPALYASVEYKTHVQNIGWQGYAKNGSVAGTTGQSLRLEGIRIRLDKANTNLTGFIQYRTHIQDVGWEKGLRGDDMMSGTEGQSKRLEAIQIRLYGDIATEYDVWYRAHVQNYGWTGWASNMTACGSEGCSYRMEAIQIMILPKGSSAPGSTANTLFTKRIEEAANESLYVKARNYVDSITNSAMTMSTKLQICFDSYRSKYEVLVWFPVYTGTDWPQKYANYFFDHSYSGDCLCFAASFAYMAKVIGYENVYALNSTGHGWVEIDGLIYDPEFSIHSYRLYATPYSSEPDYLAVRNLAGPGNTYRMKI